MDSKGSGRRRFLKRAAAMAGVFDDFQREYLASRRCLLLTFQSPRKFNWSLSPPVVAFRE